MKLYEYIIRRLLLMVFVLVAISAIIFYLGRGLLPPSFAIASYITPRMNDISKLAEAQAVGVATSSCPSWTAFTHSAQGCVVPLYEQYFSWLRNALTGNWGLSQIPAIGSGVTTWKLFAGRFPLTAELAIAAGLFTIIVAIPMGIISATHNNKPPDHASRLIALTGYSMPIFWLAYILIIVFVIYVRVPCGNFSCGLFPTGGTLATNCGICFSNPGTIKTLSGMPILDSLLSGNLHYFWDSVVPIILPMIALGYSTIGALTRVVRSSMMESLRQDYILLARSKGIVERTVVYRHALKNAILPAITIAGIIFAFLFGGVVVIEFIFSWPGVGVAAYQASIYLDINFLELYTLVFALIIVLANLTVDIMYAFIDPRIRY